MRTVVLRHWRGDQELLVSMYDDGSVTVASREEGVPGRTWGPPSSEVLSDEGDVPTFGIVFSFGMIPELWTFPTEAKAQQAWDEQVDEWLAEGYSLCTGDDPCGGGMCARWDGDHPHPLNDLRESSFVTDWDDRELRKEW